VLDEPNANLDQAGEVALAEAIVNLKRRKASIVIVGHRVSTVLQADKILVLQNGRMELFGPRDEVLKKLRTAQGDGRSQQQPVPRRVEVAEAGTGAEGSDDDDGMPSARRQQSQG
jgi:ABC-type protease/lipase transport system fused ATPase/permease subunit